MLRRPRHPLLVPLLGAALFALAACSDTTTGPQQPTDTATAPLVHVGARGAKGGVRGDLGSSQPADQGISLKRGIDGGGPLW
jgi:hypothetical protein